MYAIFALSVLVGVVVAAKCPQPSGLDLIRNSGFENHTDSIRPWLTSAEAAFTLRSPGHLSALALYLGPADTYVESSSDLAQDFNSCNNQFYLVDFFHKFIPGKNYYSNKNAQIFVAIGDITINIKPGNGGWHRTRQFYLNIGTVDSISLACMVSQTMGDQLAVDDFHVIAAPFELKAAKNTKNLIQNGDFGDGQLKPWTIKERDTKGICKVSPPGAGGGSDQGFTCKFGSRGSVVNKPNPEAGATVQQAVRTEPNQSYILSFDLLFDKFTDVEECVIELHLNDNEIIALPGEDTPSMGKNYHHFEHLIFSGAGPETDISFRMFGGNFQKFCNLGVDNVDLRKANLTQEG